MTGKSGRTINIGDQVTYRTLYGEKKSGIVADVFLSLDSSFLCLRVEGEEELITEYKLIDGVPISHLDCQKNHKMGKKSVGSKSVWYDYEVNVGTGCATGSILVSEDATDDEIRLAIMNDLYDVSYHRQEPSKEEKI